MDILYVLVFFSLAFSLGFLVVFFWAVDTDQFKSIQSAPWTMLEEDNKEKRMRATNESK